MRKMRKMKNNGLILFMCVLLAIPKITYAQETGGIPNSNTQGQEGEIAAGNLETGTGEETGIMEGTQGTEIAEGIQGTGTAEGAQGTGGEEYTGETEETGEESSETKEAEGNKEKTEGTQGKTKETKEKTEETQGKIKETKEKTEKTQGNTKETKEKTEETQGKAKETKGKTQKKKEEQKKKEPQPKKWYTDPKTGGRCYYDANKVRVTGLQKINGNLYFFSKKGIAKTGWIRYNNDLYYFGKNYRAKTGLKKINAKYYFFDAKGRMKTGLKSVDGTTYYFAQKGKKGNIGAAKSGWITFKNCCYYFDKKTYGLKKSSKRGSYIIIDGYKVDNEGKCRTRYEVRKLVNEVTRKSMSNNQKIDAIWNWLIRNRWTYTRTYEHTRSSWSWYKGWTDDFASQIIKRRSGNCFRYAAVFGYMVKEATGYDVRIYHGYTTSSRGGLTPHGWVTVKINGRWYAFDPDMQKFYPHKRIYYKTLYSITQKSIHRRGNYTQI